MGRFAKDGLIQYRNSCQQVNVTSFEEVTKQLVRLATEKAEEALDKEALDVDGLEITAHKAFQFCKKYKRPTEFRRLCETMRNNLANLDKYRDQRDRPDLTEPETLQLYLDTRFEQLKVATELGLWQEAFRSVEDIYGLMCMVKKTPKSSLLVVYYSKLTEIFWTSSSHLYHAYAWLKLFSLQKNFNKKLSQKDLQLLASSVVLAALSVPPFGQARGASRLEFETEKEGNLKMANLIGFNLELKFESRDMLSRESLLSELVSSGVLSCATQEVKDLYHQLEHEFHPLDLGSDTKPLLDRISKLGGKLSTAPSLPEVQLSQYVPSLKKLATLKLLQHVSKMYQTIRIEFLAQLVPFLDFSDVEKISVEAVKHNFIAMKVDHVKGFVTFGNLGNESDGLRDPLTIFAETMNKVRAMLFPASSKLGDIVVPNLVETVEKEHKRLLARQSFIEKRKEEQERQLLEMEHEEEKRKLKLRMQTEEAEQKRLASEVEQRRRQRILREIEERELEKAQALLENTENHQIKVEEMERKLLKLAKRMDHLERAKREESTPLIEAAYQQRLVEEIESHEQEQQREVELSRERHESELKEKRRVTRMLSSESFVENMVIFQNRVIRLREAEFERQKREKEEHLQARKQERDVKRKKIYYLKCEEERIRKLQEEEEARKQRGPSQSSAKYIPKFRLSQATEVSGSSDDQWGSRRPQHSGRNNAPPLVEGDQCGNGGERPGGDSWRSEEGRYAFRSGSPRSSFSSRTSQR
ncbi:Eukaryotic translation initiation factor 3 subunit A [Raphanus sativus]|nr:Eukaryotic translation initiation factor 3 subunit A [Raphanus sativus]